MYQKVRGLGGVFTPDSMLNLDTGEVVSRGGRGWDDFASWVAAGGLPAEPEAPYPTIAHVKAEAQRRIIRVSRATDLQGSLIKQLNANMRANELNFILASGREWSLEEAGEAFRLQALAEEVKRLRERSNELEQTLPVNFRDDVVWE